MAAAPIISLADCEAVLNTEEHLDYPDALTQITVKVTHPQHGRVASLEALLIDRSQINPEDFISIMDDESDELQKFAVGVFDSQARIKQRLVDHEHHKGSGCWGAEFNNGRIAYVSTVDVQPPFRRKGLGTLALRKLMDSNLIHQDDFLAAWPTAYPEDEAAMAEITERHDGVVSFFHNNGFRRIGRTQFLAYSPNPAHRSRNLAVADDAPDESGYHPHPNVAHAAQGPAAQQTYPLHYAIGGASPRGPPPVGPGMPPIQLPPRPTIDVVQAINDAYAADHASVTKRDHTGWTPLHVAAAAYNVNAIRALLALPEEAGVRPLLTARDNAQGLTPLDLVERGMESSRTMTQALLGLDLWQGHDDRAVRCLYILKCAEGQDPWTEAERANTSLNLDGMTEQQKEDRFVQLRRYECTCGRCVAGWFSPRMRLRLASAAMEIFGMIALPPIDPRFTPALQPEFYEHTLGMAYIPPDVRHRVNRAWFKSYHTLFYVIADMLRGSGDLVPNRAGILEYAVDEPVPDLGGDDNDDEGAHDDIYALLRRDYLARDGRVEFALDAVVATAKEFAPPPHGDGAFEEARADPEDSMHDTWAALPACGNDLTFGVVRENLGIGLGGPFVGGPYFEQGAAAGMGWGMDGVGLGMNGLHGPHVVDDANDPDTIVAHILQQFAQPQAV